MGLGYEREREGAVTETDETAAAMSLVDYGSNQACQDELHALPVPTDGIGWMDGIAVGSGMADWASDDVGIAAALPDLARLLDSLGKQSVALATAIVAARSAGFTFVYGAPGAGTCTNNSSSPPTVEIDPNDVASPLLASTLAHELGHVVDGSPVYEFDPSMNREQYIRRNTIIDLEGEAAATLMELRVRDEVMNGGGADPGITGQTATDKIRLWGEHRAGTLTHDQLVYEIVLLFARVEQPSTDASATTYWDFYASAHAAAWDAKNPTTTPLPLPAPP